MLLDSIFIIVIITIVLFIIIKLLKSICLAFNLDLDVLLIMYFITLKSHAIGAKLEEKWIKEFI